MPKDRYDLRLAVVTAVVVGGVVAAVLLGAKALWFAGPGQTLGPLPFQLFLIGIALACLRLIYFRVDMTPAGLEAAGLGYVEKIPWEEIEAVEPLSRSEALLAALRFTKGQNGITCAGYVRVRHKRGVFMFAPHDRTEFLRTMQTYLTARPAAVQIPVWQYTEGANVEAPVVQKAGRC